MQALMNFPDQKNVGAGGFYIKEVFHENHLQIRVKQEKYTSIHDFEYDKVKKEIKIFSRLDRSAYLIYGYLSLPLMVLFSDKTSTSKVVLIAITLALFVVLTLILSVGMKSEAKEIEREMIIRINYNRRNPN